MLKLTKSEVVWEAVYRGLYGAPELDTSVYQKRVNEASSWIERVKICTKRWSVPMPLYGYWNAPQNTPPRISSRILPKPPFLNLLFFLLSLPFLLGVQHRSLYFHQNLRWQREGNTPAAVLCNENLMYVVPFLVCKVSFQKTRRRGKSCAYTLSLPMRLLPAPPSILLLPHLHVLQPSYSLCVFFILFYFFF